MNSVKGLCIKRTAHGGEGGFTDTVSIRRRALINKPGNYIWEIQTEQVIPM